MTTVGGADIPTDDLDLELPPGAEPVARSNWQLFWRRFFRHKVAVASIFVLVVLVVVCFGAHWIAPYHRNEQHLLDSATGPNAKHWFGTDDLGRDQLTEVLYAGQVSLKIGIVVAFLSTVVGVVVGALAGYYGKWVDQGLSRVTDLFLIVPDLAILAVALKKLGQTTTWIVVVLAVLGWTYVARVVRGQVLSAKETEYVEAAPRLGCVGSAHHRAPHIAELLRPDHGERHPRDRDRDRRGVDVVVSRVRGAAAEQLVGVDDLQRGVGGNRLQPLLPDSVSRAHVALGGPGRELPRRRPARRVRRAGRSVTWGPR